MTCAACGFENAPGARFCGSCGQALEQRCPSCGEALTPGLAFCTSCGARIEGGPAPSAESREERKVVTVLFCDLVGFTSRAEQLDPEDVRRVLSPFYARLRAELERFGGTVEKFIGDAVMALFGAPVAHEDDPERAVRAALAIREAVAGLNEENPALNLQVRIAVNTGEAMIALGARPSEGEGMAAGDVVNSAARMQSAAPVGGILVGETTYRATRQAIEYRDAEPIAAKGKADPVPVWEAVAARWRFGVDVAQLGGSELVGRGEELDLLRDALNRARRERASQLVTLVGEPGIGKSRLVYELFKAVDAEPDLTYWRQGRSLPYGDGVTFWALSEMAKSHSGVLETDSAESAEEKLRQAVAEAIADPVDVDWVLGHLRPLVGLAGDVELTADSRAEIFAAWRKFFEAIAEKRSLVLVFEDLQWADDGLLDFVDHLVEWASGVPLLCVCTARPELLERRPDWGGGKRNATTISLSPLSDDDTARLVHALLGTSVLPSELQSTLLARASGNPLYAEEFARLVEERRGEEGELPLPESVQGIIAARVDSLPPEEKELLQDAAVVGKVMWVGTVAALEGIERWTVEERLHALERKEFVRREQRSTLEGETEYAFRHILVRDVAYGQIPRSARAEKHRVVAEWIESIGERTEDRAEMLAHHYLSALEFSRASGQSTEALAGPARVALREAGDRAWGLAGLQAAKRFYEAAVELWSDEPGRPDVLFRYGRALRLTDGTGDEELAEARDGLLAAGDRETAASAEAMRARLSWDRGATIEALEQIERASALVEEAPPSFAKTHVLAERARILHFAGKSREAIEIGREGLKMAEAIDDKEQQAEFLNTIGIARAMSDDSDRGAVEDLERSIAFGQESRAPDALSRAIFNLAQVRMLTLGLGDTQELWDEGAELNEHYGIDSGIRWFRGGYAGFLALAGRWDEAFRLADEFIAEVEAGTVHYQVAEVWVVRGAIRLARGDIEGALDDASNAVEFARAAKDVQLVQPTFGFSSRAHAMAGERAQAEELVEEVLATAPMIGMYATDLAWATRELGRGDAFLERAFAPQSDEREPSPWRAAGCAVAVGDLDRAAELYEEIGARPHWAYARLAAAEERGTAGPELEHALAFYREVGATAYLERGEALLAKSA